MEKSRDITFPTKVHLVKAMSIQSSQCSEAKSRWEEKDSINISNCMFLQRSKAKFREMKGKERDAKSKKENTS